MRSPAPVVSVPDSSRLGRALLTKRFGGRGAGTGCGGQGSGRTSRAAGVTRLSPATLQDNDTCEEWERHEALHEDVTKQERVEERLFEEEIELKWEKGGSGLVFYTDAQYWQEKNGGNAGVCVTVSLTRYKPHSIPQILPSLLRPSLDHQTHRVQSGHQSPLWSRWQPVCRVSNTISFPFCQRK